jgi:hypothetical protein
MKLLYKMILDDIRKGIAEAFETPSIYNNLTAYYRLYIDDIERVVELPYPLAHIIALLFRIWHKPNQRDIHLIAQDDIGVLGQVDCFKSGIVLERIASEIRRDEVNTILANFYFEFPSILEDIRINLQLNSNSATYPTNNITFGTLLDALYFYPKEIDYSLRTWRMIYQESNNIKENGIHIKSIHNDLIDITKKIKRHI